MVHGRQQHHTLNFKSVSPSSSSKDQGVNRKPVTKPGVIGKGNGREEVMSGAWPPSMAEQGKSRTGSDSNPRGSRDGFVVGIGGRYTSIEVSKGHTHMHMHTHMHARTCTGAHHRTHETHEATPTRTRTSSDEC